MKKSIRVSSIGRVAILCAVLAGCGGGGGGSGGNAAGAAPTSGGSGSVTTVGSALTFNSPETFVNGRIYETARGIVEIQGRLESWLTPTLDCSAGQTTSPVSAGVRIRWENAATEEGGETEGYVSCYNTGTIFGTGVRSYWSIGYVALALGMNEIRFRTYDSGRLVGEDLIRIHRVDGVAPKVVYRYPADGEESVPVNRPVLVVFSEPMLERSLDATALILTEEGGSGVAASLDYDTQLNTWRFDPVDDLAPDMLYEVRLSGRVEDVGGGGELGDDQVWQFRTGTAADETALEVSDRWPDAAGCDCADIDTVIQVAFGEPVDPWSISSEALILSSETAGRAPGRVRFLGDHLELIPDLPLAPDTEYRVTVAAGLADSTGRPLGSASSWTFRTGGAESVGSWETLTVPPVALSGAGGVWMDDAWFIWGTANGSEAPCTNPDLCANAEIGRGLIYEPSSDRWTEAGFELDRYDFDARSDVATPFPEPRRAPSLVWTGTEVLLFAGGGSGDGGAYDPVADSWRTMANSWRDPVTGTYLTFRGLGGQSSLWTGEELLIWGGAYGRDAEPVDRGWRYHPALDRWLILGDEESVDEDWNLVSDGDPLAPEARKGHAAVWTGSEMVVWGGQGTETEALNSVGRYDLGGAAWRAATSETSVEGSPGDLIAVWTGERMLAWNGGSLAHDPQAVRRVTLGSYDPAADLWTASGAGWEPEFLTRSLEADGALVQGGVGRLEAFWTGTVLLVAGVEAIEYRYDAEIGGWSKRVTVAVHIYDPTTDRWLPGGRVQASTAAAASDNFEAAWTGEDLLILIGSQLHGFTPPQV